MPRRRPENRLDQLVASAAQVFTARGYRRTQMADVARAMGIAPGTLYLYVESKEALFDLVVQRAFLDRQPGPPPTLPIPTPAPGVTVEHVRQRMRREHKLPVLFAAARRQRTADPRAELAGVVRELYTVIARNHRGARLLERSALDRPDLAALYFKRLRRGLIDGLTAYLERRISQKQFRRVPDTAIAARMIIETVAWFAMHRHGDPEPVPMDDRRAEDTVVDMLVHALIAK
jgi:AcrR family transcriptional regulator